MKVVITGGTGWVGHEVLVAALSHEAISHIVLLQRRAHSPPVSAPPGSNKTIETINHSDFSSFPDSLAQHIVSASAIIWCLGGRHNKFPDLETAQRVNVDYTRAFTDFLKTKVLPIIGTERRLRVVLCSGAKAEWNPETKLWFLEETRKTKGAAEQAIFGLESVVGGGRGGKEGRESKERTPIEAYTCRPAVIMSKSPGWVEWVHGLVAPSVGLDALAAVMVDLAVTGSDARFWEFDMIKRRAEELTRV